MKIIDQIQTAQANLLRSKSRTILTILAIVIGTFMLSMTTGLTQGIRHYIDLQTTAYAQPNAIIVMPVRKEGRGQSDFAASRVVALKQSDLDAVKAVTGVTDAYPFYSVSPSSLIYNGKSKDISSGGLGTYFPGDKLSLSAGSQPDPTDTAALLLPYPNLADFGFAKPEDALGKSIQLTLQNQPADAKTQPQTKTLTLTVRGVLLNSIANQPPFVTYRLNQELAQFQQGPAAAFSYIVAEVKPGVDAQSVKTQIAAKGYNAITYADQIGSRQQAIDLVTLILDGFAAVALLVATIGIINTLLMAVLERTQEIGLLKALGLKRRELFSLFAYEAISLGFWGGLVGISLGLAAGPLVNLFIAHRQNGNGFTMVFPPLYMAAIVLGAMIVGFLAGVIPAMRAARLDPIEALRRE